MPATQVGPVDITIESTTISPANFCPTSEQDRLDKYAQHLTGSLPGGYSTFVIGNAKPNAIDQNKAWFRLDSAGRPDKWYTFANGVWQSPHLVPPGYIQLYMGDITSIDTFDGGEVATVSATTGPFWEELKDLRASSPQPYYGRCAVHPDPSGNLITNQTVNLIPAGGTGTGNRIVYGSTGGEERHQLTEAELAEHNHTFTGFGGNLAAPGSNGFWAVVSASPRDTQNSGGDQPHQNMPPYFGAYYIRRTARTHYRVDP